MKDKRNDIYSGIVLVLFAIFMYATSYMIQPTTSDILGSRFFPRMVAIIIGVLAICMIVSAAAALKKAEKPAEEEKPEKKPLNMPLVLTIVGLFAYYVLISLLGFTITSILYLLFQGAVLMGKEGLKNKRSLIILVVTAVVIPIALNNIFWSVFKISLPASTLFK